MASPLLPITLAMPATGRDAPLDELFEHLEPLYALAQVLAPGPGEAAALVELTYRQAYLQMEQKDPERDIRTWLLGLMHQVHLERSNSSFGEVIDASDTYRASVARRSAERALPAALAMLPSDQRFILAVCDGQNYSLEEAAGVMALPLEEASSLLVRARAALHSATLANMTELERRLVRTALQATWLDECLRDLVSQELSLLPPTLRPAIAERLRQQQEATELQEATESAKSRRKRGIRVPRVVLVLALIVLAGSVGWLLSRPPGEQPPETNLITLSSRLSDDVSPAFATGSTTQAAQFVRDEFDRRVNVPDIAGAQLSGVGLVDVTDEIRVPVFIYENGEAGQIVHIFGYNYGLLHRFPEQIQLDIDILRQIEDEGRFDLHDMGDERVLVWRVRDDIFIAVTPGDGVELRRRIQQAF
jgi:DNA-directed RNA polymerase specialized sigma24 family protein